MEIHQRTGKLTAPYQHLVRYSQGDQVILNKTGDLTIFIRNKLDLHTECNYEYLYGVCGEIFPSIALIRCLEERIIIVFRACTILKIVKNGFDSTHLFFSEVLFSFNSPLLHDMIQRTSVTELLYQLYTAVPYRGHGCVVVYYMWV